MLSFLRFVLIISMCGLFIYACQSTNVPVQTPVQSSVNELAIPYPSDHYNETLDGRMILLLSSTAEDDLRTKLNDRASSCQGFWMDIEGWTLGQSMTFNQSGFGYPIASLSDIDDGEYHVQIVFINMKHLHAQMDIL